MRSSQSHDYVDSKEAASLLNSSDRGIRYLLKSGTLQGVNPTGRKWLIPRSEINRFLGLKQKSTHEEELREQLRTWDALLANETRERWIEFAYQQLASPVGLLTFAKSASFAIDSAPANRRSVHGKVGAFASSNRGFSMERSLPAPPSVSAVREFELLRAHLRHESIWKEWSSAAKILDQLAPLAWSCAYCVVMYAIGLAFHSEGRALSAKQAVARLRHVAEDPTARDALSSLLTPLIFLTGSELVQLGISELVGEKGVDGRGAPGLVDDTPRLTWSAAAMEDQLQRAQIPQGLDRPTLNDVREAAKLLWNGDMAFTQLDKEHVLQLLRLWYRWIQARDQVRMLLRGLMTQVPFPGVCPECQQP